MNVLLLLIVLAATSAQFLEQPDPGTVFSPIQDRVTLTCSVEEGHFVDWRVTFASEEVAYASSVISSRQLMRQQFTLEGVDTNRSTLSLRETVNQTNNGTNITCIAQEKGTIMSTAGNTVQVIFYGIPPPPTGLSVTEIELGSLNISWSLKFIEGVPVNYTLTVLNLNTTSAQPIIIAGLLDQHYVFETSRPCDVYSFTVTAVTAAGNSIPSQELIFITSPCITLSTQSKYTPKSTAKVTAHRSYTTNPEGLGAEVYIGTTAGACITPMLIGIILYCACKQARKKSSCGCTKDVKHQVHKTKAETIANTPGPVYETAKEVLSSANNAETPFAMTLSSAYGVSIMSPQEKSPEISFSANGSLDARCSVTLSAMTLSPVYEIVV